MHIVYIIYFTIDYTLLFGQGFQTATHTTMHLVPKIHFFDSVLVLSNIRKHTIHKKYWRNVLSPLVVLFHGSYQLIIHSLYRVNAHYNYGVSDLYKHVTTIIYIF